MVANILSSEYGVGLVAANWIAVTWTVGQIERNHGATVAANEMRKANRIRERHGVYTDIPAYGTELFRAYFAK